MNNCLNVFISYNRKDLSLAKVIETIFHANGMRAWRDLEYLPYGKNTEVEIIKAIKNECSAFVIIITENSLTSDFIWDIEIPTAVKKANESNGEFLFVPIFISNSLISKVSEKSMKIIGEDLGNKNGIILNSNEDYLMLHKLAGGILESLIYNQNYTKIKVFTHGEISNEENADIIIDIRSSFQQNIPCDSEWKNVIIPGLYNVKKALLHKRNPQKKVWLPSRIHLSAALAYGWTFRKTTGFILEASDELKQENPEEIHDDDILISMDELIVSGIRTENNLALIVSLAKDVRPTFKRLLRFKNYSYKSCVQLTTKKIGSTSIINTTHAKRLAKQTVDSLMKYKNYFSTTNTDLFVSGSVQYVTYLGYYLNACGPFVFWRYSMMDDIHSPSINLSLLYENDT